MQDVVSFEPDYILQSEKPRLHYYDEENSAAVFIHELTTQQTIKIGLANMEELPREFASIQVLNKIYLCGGEKKENDFRTVVLNDFWVLNEQKCELECLAPMKT